jgi:hypothetical protein
MSFFALLWFFLGGSLMNYPEITAQFAIYFDYFAKNACNLLVLF